VNLGMQGWLVILMISVLLSIGIGHTLGVRKATNYWQGTALNAIIQQKIAVIMWKRYQNKAKKLRTKVTDLEWICKQNQIHIETYNSDSRYCYTDKEGCAFSRLEEGGGK